MSSAAPRTPPASPPAFLAETIKHTMLILESEILMTRKRRVNFAKKICCAAGLTFTVLCFDLLVLLNLPEVLLSLLLQCCDVTPQGRQVRGGTSSLKEAKLTSFKSVEIT